MESAPATPSAASWASGPHELRMVFDRETWVRVVVDGSKTQHGLYGPGMNETWTADKSFSVRVGNAGGVQAYVDGQPLPSLGAPGEVVNLELPGTCADAFQRFRPRRAFRGPRRRADITTGSHRGGPVQFRPSVWSEMQQGRHRTSPSSSTGYCTASDLIVALSPANSGTFVVWPNTPAKAQAFRKCIRLPPSGGMAFSLSRPGSGQLWRKAKSSAVSTGSPRRTSAGVFRTGPGAGGCVFRSLDPMPEAFDLWSGVWTAWTGA